MPHAFASTKRKKVDLEMALHMCHSPRKTALEKGLLKAGAAASVVLSETQKNKTFLSLRLDPLKMTP